MRNKFVILGVCVIGFSASANAETWTAGAVLLPERSTPNCKNDDYSKLQYEFTLEGNTLSGSRNGKKVFTTTTTADGMVDVTFMFTNQTNTFPVQITGNARTRALESYSSKWGCRQKLVPR